MRRILIGASVFAAIMLAVFVVHEFRAEERLAEARNALEVEDVPPTVAVASEQPELPPLNTAGVTPADHATPVADATPDSFAEKEECCPDTELLDPELAGYAEMVKDIPKEVWEGAETLRQYYEALDNYFEKFWVLDKKLEMLDREFATLDPGFLDFIFDFSDLSHLNMIPEQTEQYKAFIRERYGGLVQQDISQRERAAKMTENMKQQEDWKREYDALALKYPDLPALKHTH